MKWRKRGEPYEFRELGSLEFKRLCVELLAVEAEFASVEWREHAFGQAVMSDKPVMLGDQLGRPPTLVVIAGWATHTSEKHQRRAQVPTGAPSEHDCGPRPAPSTRGGCPRLGETSVPEAPLFDGAGSTVERLVHRADDEGAVSDG